MNKKIFYLVYGVPGSGKSTYVEKELKIKYKDLQHFEADMFFYNKNGVYQFNPKKLGLLGKYKIYFVDDVVGIIISIWIFHTAYKIFKDSYDVLMDKAISNETREEVYKVIKNYKQIKKVNHFNATPVGYQYQISFTIFVDGNMSTYESHKIANDLEKEIDNKFPEIYLTVIHVNPLDIKND